MPARASCRGRAENRTATIAELTGRARRLQASFNLLFLVPSGEDLALGESPHRRFLGQYRQALAKLLVELTALAADPGLSRRWHEAVDDTHDSLDHLNALVALAGDQSLRKSLAVCLLDALTAGPLFQDTDPAKAAGNPALQHQLRHVERLARDGMAVFAEYVALLQDMAGHDAAEPRLAPGLVVGADAAPTLMPVVTGDLTPELVAELRTCAGQVDPFLASRVFRYGGGEFVPADLASIRSVEQFYGFRPARDLFRHYFQSFAVGESNLPLLISSLPGLGKTHFTIAHALAHPEMILILPEPTELERPLEILIRQLARRRNRRFVLFFDDVDTRKVDWYHFRTHVGGSFVLPDNLAIVITSNYEFPANIASRGRGFTFPMFDEISCQEMVADYLHSLGMRQPPVNLISVIAADYVEEYGQKLFEELSPRTLVRYLDRYNRDQKKRQRMLDLSREEVVTKPDAQCFFEANQKILERLRQSS